MLENLFIFVEPPPGPDRMPELPFCMMETMVLGFKELRDDGIVVTPPVSVEAPQLGSRCMLGSEDPLLACVRALVVETLAMPKSSVPGLLRAVLFPEFSLGLTQRGLTSFGACKSTSSYSSTSAS